MAPVTAGLAASRGCPAVPRGEVSSPEVNESGRPAVGGWLTGLTRSEAAVLATCPPGTAAQAGPVTVTVTVVATAGAVSPVARGNRPRPER
jgi:hypothetical protein